MEENNFTFNTEVVSPEVITLPQVHFSSSTSQQTPSVEKHALNDPPSVAATFTHITNNR